MKKKVIVFVLAKFAQDGVSTYVKNQAHILKRNNIQSVIVGFSGHLSKTYFSDSNVVEIKNTSSHKFLQFFLLLLTCKQILTRYKNDNLIFHLQIVPAAIPILFLNLIFKFKIIYTFHGSELLERKSLKSPSQQNFIFIFKTYLLHYFQILIIKKATKIIALSEYSKKIIATNFPIKLVKKTIVIPGFLISKNKKQTVFKNNAKKSITLLNIGRAEPRKGLPILLKALSILKKKDIDFTCYIASPVDFLIWYKEVLITYEDEKLFKNVHFIHTIDDKEKDILFSESDLFIMPSQDLETFGYTTIEALSYGLPVIGSNSGATLEILKKISKNLLFENKSHISLANKILWYISLDEKEKISLRQKCLDIFSKKYTGKMYESKILNLYDINLIQ